MGLESVAFSAGSGEGGRKEVQRYVLFVHTLRVSTVVVVKSVAVERRVSHSDMWRQSIDSRRGFMHLPSPIVGPKATHQRSDVFPRQGRDPS